MTFINQNEGHSFNQNDLIKMTGIVILLSLLSTGVILTNSVYEMENVHNSSDCIQLSATKETSEFQTWNDTLCNYMKPFKLAGEYYVTVCLYQKAVR
jgi:hypothetical protein